MPTVIDSLIVEVGLDPSKFNAGQKAAIKSFTDAKDSAVKVGNDIEAVGKRSAEFLNVLSTKLLGVTAIITGGLGIERLVGQITKQDAATGRLAYTLGTTVGQLDKWRNAAFIVGGTQEGVTGFIKHLSDAYEDFRIHGTSEMIPYLNALGTSFEDSEHHAKPFETIMREISHRVQSLDPAAARRWLESIGADPGSIQLLMNGTDALDNYLKKAQQFGNLTPEQAENARKLAESYNQLSLAMTEWSRVVLNALTPALLKIQDFFTKSISERNEHINKRSALGRFMEYFHMFKDTSKATPDEGGGTGSSFPSKGERIAYYRNLAAQKGQDPNVWERLVRGEGLDKYIGDEGSSFGDFQLHFGGMSSKMPHSGLGEEFRKKTGLDPKDPSTWKEQAAFSMDWAATHGLHDWTGWSGSPMQGMPRGQSSTTTNDIRINSINIYPPNGDADTISSSIGPAIKRNALSYQGQGGPQ